MINARLNKSNWVQIAQKGTVVEMKHHKKSYLRLFYNKNNHTGVFYDARTAKQISQPKEIVWLKVS